MLQIQLLEDKANPRKLKSAIKRNSYHGTENQNEHKQTANAFPDYQLCKHYLRQKHMIDLDTDQENERQKGSIKTTEKETETFRNKQIGEIKSGGNKGLYPSLKQYLNEESENKENSKNELYKNVTPRRISSASKTEELTDSESLTEVESDEHIRFQERNPTIKTVGESFRYCKEDADLY